MRQIKKGKQLLAVALSALLAVSSLPTMAFANGGGQNPGENTVDCGYAQGQPCGHKHSKACYTDDLICGYIVDEENIASDSDATASDSNAEHTHTQECYALDCPHERGEHKVNGVPEKTITAWTFIDDDHYLTEGELALPGVNAGSQADFDTVVSMLPMQIRAEVEGETDPIPVDITGWSCPEFVKDPDGNWPLTGEYTFTAKLQEGYVCEPLPTVKVLVGGAELYAAETGDFTVTGNSTDYEFKDPVLTIKSGATVTIKNTNPNAPTTHRIKVAENAINVNITLAGVNIEEDDKSDFCAFEIATGATVTLNLEASSDNILKSALYRAGLEVPDGAKVIIDGDGSLDASSSGDGAGIGSGMATANNLKSGEIEIRGGIITATSDDLGVGDGGAGIGGGSGVNSDFFNAVSNGTVIISGGVVTATGGGNAAGIGGGGSSMCSGGDGGIVTISGGKVTAIGAGGGGGIGGGGCNEVEGSGGGTGSTVMISGTDTQVTATGGSRGPDIGGGAGKEAGTFGKGGSLTVEEATLEMTESGTNAKNPDYKNCTIIDKDNVHVKYNSDGKVKTTLTLEVSPTGTLKLPGDVILTATFSGAASDDSNKEIIFTANDATYYVFTKSGGKATCKITNPVEGTYTFGASFAGDDKNNAATANSISGYTVVLADQNNFAISDPGTKTYGDSSFTLEARGGQSEGGISFSAPENNGVLTVTENGMVNITGAGSVTVRATKAGDNTYKEAVATLELTVAPRDISHVAVAVTGSRIYTGSQLQPAFEVKDGSIAITAGDYTYSYGPNVDAGTGAGSITLTGQRNYTGTKEVSFDIEKRSLTGAAITLKSGPYRYTGTEVKPAVTGVMLEGIVIPAGAFDVGYTDNTGTGTATVTITAKADSNFSGSASTTFEITKSRSSDNDSYSGNYTNPHILRGSWIQTEAGVWMFRQTGGSYAMNRWEMVDGLWYFFDAEGKMLTGWQFLGGQWYYLCTKEDLAAKAGMKEGAMASGWHFDPLYQKWFYLDTNGAMVSGWLEIDGKWHYFNPASDGTRGAMVTDSVIDGRYIDKNGVWNGN